MTALSPGTDTAPVDAATTPSTPSDDREGRRQAASRTKARQARALVLPTLIFLNLLTQIPFLVTIYFSFLSWNQLRPGDIAFTGFENYAAVFTGPDFLPSLGETVRMTGSAVVLSLLFGLIFAILLDRKFVGRGVARTLMITPFLVMPAAAALIWKWSMLDANVRYAEAVYERGEPIIVDAQRDDLVALTRTQRENPLAFLQNRRLFGDLAENERFAGAYLSAINSLFHCGALDTVRGLAANAPARS